MSERAVLDVEGICARIERLDETARTQARERQERLLKSVGSLGRLEELSVWLAAAQQQCPPRPLRRVRVVIFAADHGVAASGVSAFPPTRTAQTVRSVLSGGAAVNAFARVAGAEVRILDVGLNIDDAAEGDLPVDVTRLKVRRGSGRIDIEDALTREEAEQAFQVGMQVCDEEVDSGADLFVLGDLGTGNTTHAAAIIGTLTKLDAAAVTGRGSGIDDFAWMRKCAAVRDAMRRARPVLPDQVQLLATIGGADFAAMTGFLLQASTRRTPVVLDGLSSAACALVAQRICFRGPEWWIAGHLSPEPAHEPALRRAGLEAVLEFGLRLGEGTGGLLAVPILQAAAATLAEMSTSDDADVTQPPAS